MKKIFITVFVLSISITACVAQIGTTIVPSKAQQIATFDSTKNYLGAINIETYIGQVLYVSPFPTGISQENRFKSYDYRLDSTISRYSDPNENRYDIAYKNVAGKYFHVDTILICEKKYLGKPECVFVLSDKENKNDKCCFVYDPEFKHNFPFIVVSHFNYLKSKYVGKEFVIPERYIHKTDAVTGEPITITDASKILWMATDITVVKSYFAPPLAMIVTSGNITTYVEYLWLESDDEVTTIWEKNMWKKYVSQYGLAMMQSVLKAEPKVGMPERLLVMTLGKPSRTTSTSNGEMTLHYPQKTIVIKAGKVISWRTEK